MFAWPEKAVKKRAFWRLFVHRVNVSRKQLDGMQNLSTNAHKDKIDLKLTSN